MKTGAIDFTEKPTMSYEYHRAEMVDKRQDLEWIRLDAHTHLEIFPIIGTGGCRVQRVYRTSIMQSFICCNGIEKANAIAEQKSHFKPDGSGYL